MTNNCPPHQWNENGGKDGIVLAKCLKCDTSQWHATDGNWDTVKECNKRNKRDHLELIALKKETRFMDTSLKKDTVSGTPQGVNNNPPVRLDIPDPVSTPNIARMSLLTDPPDPPVGETAIDPRISRMRLNTGNSERWDKLAPQVLEDVKTMTWNSALRKNGIPVGSAGRLRRRWEHMELIAKPQTPFFDPPKTQKNSHPRRDYDEEKTEILKDYYSLSLKDFYDKQHLFSGTWTILKKKWGIKGKNKTGEKPNKERLFADPLTPALNTIFNRLNAIDAKLTEPIRPELNTIYAQLLPPWNEDWRDSVKCAWLKVLEVISTK